MKTKQGLGEEARLLNALALRYSLVLVLVWMGLSKLTVHETDAIQSLVVSHPLRAWTYDVFSARQFAFFLGVSELAAAALIAIRPAAPMASALGSAVAAVMFMGSISFLVTAPGWDASLGSLSSISVLQGQFLIKDFVFLGISVLTMGESILAAEESEPLERAVGFPQV